MYLVLTADETKAVEERAEREAGVAADTLMLRAGEALARALTERVPDGPVAVVCGPGNNGGDGWVCALALHRTGRRVRVLSMREPASLKGAAGRAASEALAAGVAWNAMNGSPDAAALEDAVAIVDALLGTGATLPLREPIAGWCRAIGASRAFVLAADLPTGVDSDTGAASEDAVRADCTVTFIAPKRGNVLFPGAGCSGEVVVEDLGVPEEVRSCADAPELWEPRDAAAVLPRHEPDTHKNARGRLLIVAGSWRYPGAAVLAARGAARMGAGYVTVAVPEQIVPVIQGHLVSQPVVGLAGGRARTLSSHAADAIVELSRDYDAVLIGPGLSLADGAVACVRAAVPKIARPLVIDADALNALVDAVELIDGRRAPTVLTPHPGELARLLGCDPSEVQRDRVSSCAQLANSTRVVVLKGAGTIVSDGTRHVVNATGTPALATAGTGDVLAGMVGALLAQGVTPVDAAALGAFVHGRAGEIAASELTPVCVNADDVPRFVPAAVAELLDHW